MINKQPQIQIIFDRRKKASDKKKGTLEIRLTYNYQQRYITTGIRLYPNQWRKGKVVNTSDSLILNQTLDEMLVRIRGIILNQEDSLDLDHVIATMKEDNRQLSFMEFCEIRTSIRKYGKSSDTQKRYDRFLKYFRLWGGILDFKDITEENIISYDKHLASTGMKPYSKWNNYHRFLNSFILDAIDAGYLHKNPYRWIHITKEKSAGGINKYLTPSEFRMISKALMPTASLERVRDLFVFQTHACLSYSDLVKFDVSLIHTVKKVKVYVGTRKKTGKEFIIPLLPEALRILNKYNGKLPRISNVKYNEYLKIVAMAARVDKPISSHWARHTGATLLLNSGVDMNTISKICGHSSIKITEQIYAKLLNETIVDALTKIKAPRE